MDKIKTSKTQEGNKTIYESKFESKGKLKNIIEYLKTSQSPKVTGYNSKTISVESSSNSIKRVMTCPLPDTYAVNFVVGNNPVYVTYGIEYNDEILVILATNPKEISKFFKFTDEIDITQISHDTLEFHRKARVYNFGKLYISESYQEYDDFFNDQTLAFLYGLSEIVKQSS